MIYIEAEKLVRFIARHAAFESRFLTPEPQPLVNADLLCDFIIEEKAATKEEVIRWTNDEADKVVAERATTHE